MRSWAAVLCLLALPEWAGSQSLGDASRKERERRDKLGQKHAASRTVTDEDLASNRGALANDPETAAAQTREGEYEESSAGDRPVTNGEEYWRGRAAEARGRLVRARRRYDSLQRQIRIGQPLQFNESGQRVIYSIYQMKERADAAEAELREAEAALEALDLEARRAGALPGWLR